ncbi:MAG: leucine-rich repeat domain-containing protein [Treponema sp.]|nr:leucine-rich repeat domain-containing protein [Treponema sp.]
MKKTLFIALAAMVLATAAFAADFPKYLVVVDTTVWDHTDDLPAELVIPEGVTAIGGKAFYGCYDLTSLTIPASVTSIGEKAFYECESLTSVTIPASVTSIGDDAFYGGTKLREVKFTGTKAQWKAIKGIDELKITYVQCSDGYIGVKNVPDYLKMNGTVVSGHTDGLPAELVIPDGVTGIGYDAFYNCKSLVSVTIPASVTSIGDYAFNMCTSLASVKIGDGVAEIGNSAFYRCTSLAEVTIPATVTSIRYNAFESCYKLKEVKYTGTKAQWKNMVGDIGINRFVLHCSDGDVFVQ